MKRKIEEFYLHICIFNEFSNIFKHVSGLFTVRLKSLFPMVIIIHSRASKLQNTLPYLVACLRMKVGSTELSHILQNTPLNEDNNVNEGLFCECNLKR